MAGAMELAARELAAAGGDRDGGRGAGDAARHAARGVARAPARPAAVARGGGADDDADHPAARRRRHRARAVGARARRSRPARTCCARSARCSPARCSRPTWWRCMGVGHDRADQRDLAGRHARADDHADPGIARADGLRHAVRRGVRADPPASRGSRRDARAGRRCWRCACVAVGLLGVPLLRDRGPIDRLQTRARAATPRRGRWFGARLVEWLAVRLGPAARAAHARLAARVDRPPAGPRGPAGRRSPCSASSATRRRG